MRRSFINRSKHSSNQPSSNRFITEFLEARRLLAAVSWDGGGDGTTWASANNWSTNALPGSNDDVTINVGANPTILLNVVAEINSLNCNETFRLDTGSLYVENGATFNATVNWENGVLSGTINATAASTVNLTTPAPKIIRGTFNNNGTINYTGEQFGFNGNTTLNNNGIFNANNSGAIVQAGEAGNTFKNSGTFNKNGLSTVTFGGAAFTNVGTFNLNAGGIVFAAGGSTTAAMLVPNGTSLAFSNGIFSLNVGGVSIGGLGTISLNDAAELTTSVASTQVNNLNFNGGTLNAASNAITLGNTFDWSGGLMYGNVVLAVGAVSNFAGADLKGIINNTVTNNGTINYSGSNFGFSNATFNNTGTFNAQNVTSIHQFSEINNTFNNSGIFAKTGASDFAFEGAVSFLNSGTVNLNGGTVTTGAPITGGGIMNINAATSVLIAPALDQGALQVNGGLKLTGNDHRTTVTSLVMGANSYVELGNNGLAVNYNGASPLVGLTAKLIAGRNGGAWDGVGIRSSAAAADNTTAIGFGEASHTGLNTFMGSGIDQTAVLFRHTLLGDANLDHAVNFPDLLTVAKNFGQTGLIWTRGNFNFDGSGNVDFADLLVIAQRYGNSLPTFSTLARHNGRASIGLQVLN